MSLRVEDILNLSVIALENVMKENMSLDYYERRMRRQFSEKFNTSLIDTHKIPFVDILTHLFESKYENLKNSSMDEDEDTLWEEIQLIVDPEYKKSEEEDNENFARQIEARERQKYEDKINLAKATEQAKNMAKDQMDIKNINNSNNHVKNTHHVKNTQSVNTLNNHVKNTQLRQSLTEEPQTPKGNVRVFKDEAPPEADSNGLDSLDDIVKI